MPAYLLSYWVQAPVACEVSVIDACNVRSGTRISTGISIRARAGNDFPRGLAVREQQAVNYSRCKVKFDLKITDLGMPGPLGDR